MLTEQERKDLISRLNISFCTPALWKDRESFLNLTDEQYKDSLYDLSAAILLRILTGDIASIPHLMNLLPDVGFEDFIKPVIPTISNRDFFHSLSRLAYLGVSLEPYYSTASGRPSILNGLRDFSYYGDFVLKHKDKSLELLKVFMAKITSRFMILFLPKFFISVMIILMPWYELQAQFLFWKEIKALCFLLLHCISRFLFLR